MAVGAKCAVRVACLVAGEPLVDENRPLYALASLGVDGP